MINWVIYHCGIVLSPQSFFFIFLCNLFCLSGLFALRFHYDSLRSGTAFWAYFCNVWCIYMTLKVLLRFWNTEDTLNVIYDDSWENPDVESSQHSSFLF